MWRMQYTICANLLRLPKYIGIMHRMVDQAENYSEQQRYDYVRYLVGLMKKTGRIKTQGFGLENLPREGGYVMYPNHQGKFDAYSIVDTQEKPCSVVMDREMSYFPYVSEIIDTLAGKRMDINNNRQALKIINEVAKEVGEGRRFIIFPEGAYDNKKHNSLWDFKPGCFKTATKAKVPIVPVVLVDSYKVYNSWKLTPVKCQVHYLEPIYAEEYAQMNTQQIAELVKGKIAEKLKELGF
ncbi:MAG: 1-acyl-sn-glycerol-3-phosphate acyltransferase [Oscillospiraceae bacterium]|nr:1-acyl-sn-glycerol-3-phosphate acyltransferase [Oscillospiraceae bacterium]